MRASVSGPSGGRLPAGAPPEQAGWRAAWAWLAAVRDSAVRPQGLPVLAVPGHQAVSPEPGAVCLLWETGLMGPGDLCSGERSRQSCSTSDIYSATASREPDHPCVQLTSVGMTHHVPDVGTRRHRLSAQRGRDTPAQRNKDHA